MPIVLTNPEGTGLFNRLGLIGGFLYNINAYQSNLLLSREPTFVDRFTNATPRKNELVQEFRKKCVSHASRTLEFSSFLEETALRLVADAAVSNNPHLASSLTETHLLEIISEMVRQEATVRRFTSLITLPPAGQVPNQTLVISPLTKTGADNQHLRTDSFKFTCTGDAYTGGRFPGNEEYSFVGTAAVDGVYDYTWPGGTGAGGTLQVIDTTASRSSGNFVGNPTLTTTEEWEIPVSAVTDEFGTPGVSFQDGGLLFGNTNSVIIRQDIGNNLEPHKVYAFRFQVRLMGAPATPSDGALTLALCDDVGNILNNAAGNSLAVGVSLNSLTTSAATFSGVFEIPAIIPATIYLQFRLQNVPATAGVVVGSVAVGRTVQIHTGGPFVALFGSSTTPVAKGSSFFVEVASTRSTLPYARSFQFLFERFFDLSTLGLQLPSGDTPNILDTLIT